MCKKIHRGGNAEQYYADKKYKEAVAEAVEACADDKGQLHLHPGPPQNEADRSAWLLVSCTGGAGEDFVTRTVRRHSSTKCEAKRALKKPLSLRVLRAKQRSRSEGRVEEYPGNCAQRLIFSDIAHAEKILGTATARRRVQERRRALAAKRRASPGPQDGS